MYVRLKNTVERAVYQFAEEDEVDDIILDPFEDLLTD